jgi:hypothetical protein
MPDAYKGLINEVVGLNFRARPLLLVEQVAFAAPVHHGQRSIFAGSQVLCTL